MLCASLPIDRPVLWRCAQKHATEHNFRQRHNKSAWDKSKEMVRSSAFLSGVFFFIIFAIQLAPSFVCSKRDTYLMRWERVYWKVNGNSQGERQKKWLLHWHIEIECHQSGAMCLQSKPIPSVGLRPHSIYCVGRHTKFSRQAGIVRQTTMPSRQGHALNTNSPSQLCSCKYAANISTIVHEADCGRGKSLGIEQSSRAWIKY